MRNLRPTRRISSETPPGQRASEARDPVVIAHLRRRRRWAWFIAAEIGAGAFLVASVTAGISERFAAESLTPLFRVLPIAAASLVAILPILFFGDPKRRSRRWR